MSCTLYKGTGHASTVDGGTGPRLLSRCFFAAAVDTWRQGGAVHQGASCPPWARRAMMDEQVTTCTSAAFWQKAVCGYNCHGTTQGQHPANQVRLWANNAKGLRKTAAAAARRQHVHTTTQHTSSHVCTHAHVSLAHVRTDTCTTACPCGEQPSSWLQLHANRIPTWGQNA